MSANAAEQAGVRNLDVKNAEKLEVCYSMIGLRDTLVFYTFKDQQAILKLTIDNKDESFPVTGKVYLFDKKTTEQGLGKWINNQHSDGLYPDIPDPIFTEMLPEGSCVVTAHKQLGVTKDTGLRKVDFKNFEVDLSIKAHQVDDQFTLSAFTDSSQVYAEVE
jgi:hypothetical protein